MEYALEKIEMYNKLVESHRQSDEVKYDHLIYKINKQQKIILDLTESTERFSKELTEKNLEILKLNDENNELMTEVRVLRKLLMRNSNRCNTTIEK